jgi:hypothetical protein
MIIGDPVPTPIASGGASLLVITIGIHNSRKSKGCQTGPMAFLGSVNFEEGWKAQVRAARQENVGVKRTKRYLTGDAGSTVQRIGAVG